MQFPDIASHPVDRRNIQICLGVKLEMVIMSLRGGAIESLCEVVILGAEMHSESSPLTKYYKEPLSLSGSPGTSCCAKNTYEKKRKIKMQEFAFHDVSAVLVKRLIM